MDETGRLNGGHLPDENLPVFPHTRHLTTIRADAHGQQAGLFVVVQIGKALPCTVGCQQGNADTFVFADTGQHRLSLAGSRDPLAKGYLADTLAMGLDHLDQLLIPCAPNIDGPLPGARGQIAPVQAEANAVDQAKRLGEGAVDDFGVGEVGVGQADPAQMELAQKEMGKIVARQVYLQGQEKVEQIGRGIAGLGRLGVETVQKFSQPILRTPPAPLGHQSLGHGLQE